MNTQLIRSSLLVLSLGALAGAQSASGPVVRRSSGDEVRAQSNTTAQPTNSSTSAATVSVCSTLAVIGNGAAVPGGGTLACSAQSNPATRSGVDGSAFFSRVIGSPNNQGIFVADAQGLHEIAKGSGGGGGSGVPGIGTGTVSPIGGQFASFFESTFFAPGTNRNGDVLFMADVDGGSSTRGLFLWIAASQTFVAVAAIGDPSPVGGTLTEIGPGSLNDARQVVFLARGSTAQNDLILQWSGGVLTKIAANGDPAPGGGTYASLGAESLAFADGTTIPIGPVPDVNDAGQIAFRAVTDINRPGIVVVVGGVHQWYVQAGDPTPHGGTYLDMRAACLDDAGQIAFFADWKPTPTTGNSGWFVGEPGAWRSGLSFHDAVGGGQCMALAVSRNPMQPLDEQGNLLQWTRIDLGGGSSSEALVISAADGSLTIAAQQGDAAPDGGHYSAFDGWPSMTGLRASFGATTPGGAEPNAYCQFTECAPAPVAYCTGKLNSLGCAPAMSSTGTSSASATSGFTLTGAPLLNGKFGVLIYSVTGRAALPFGGGTLCMQVPVKGMPVLSSGGNPPPDDCSGSISLDMNAYASGASGGNPLPELSQPGTTVETQVWSRDPGFTAPNNVSLTDALEYVVGT